jgi:hypothetical protein
MRTHFVNGQVVARLVGEINCRFKQFKSPVGTHQGGRNSGVLELYVWTMLIFHPFRARACQNHELSFHGRFLRSAKLLLQNCAIR